MKVLIDSTTGAALSFGTVFADPLPDGTELVDLGDSVDLASQTWDPEVRKLIPLPVPVVPVPEDAAAIQAILTKPSKDFTTADLADAIKVFMRRV